MFNNKQFIILNALAGRCLRKVNTTNELKGLGASKPPTLLFFNNKIYNNNNPLTIKINNKTIKVINENKQLKILYIFELYIKDNETDSIAEVKINNESDTGSPKMSRSSTQSSESHSLVPNR